MTESSDGLLFDLSTEPVERHANHVRVRVDGKGDGWAEQHRKSLGKDYYFQDVDGLFGGMVYGSNTAERLFLEYVPDNYRNRESRIRTFGIIALFDRKSSLDAARHSRNDISLAVYLHLCRVIGECQPMAPKFLFVVGGSYPPWYLYDVDILTAEMSESPTEIGEGDWKMIWEHLGLKALRDALSAWVQ